MKLNYKDIEAFKIFTITPYASPEAMKTFVTENRLRTYKKEGLVRKIKYYDQKHNCNKVAYSLTHKGQEWSQKSLYLNTTYTLDRRTARHDCKVSEAYAMLDPVERENAVSEHHFRDIAQEAMEKYLEQGEWERAKEIQQALLHSQFSAPDIIYHTPEGQIVCCEVVTEHYSGSECQIKADTSTLIGADYYQIHT